MAMKEAGAPGPPPQPVPEVPAAPGQVARLRRRSAFTAAAWLGWMVESNWADPVLFAGYSIVKPVAHALILVVMYRVVAGDLRSPYFAAMLAGHGFYYLVGQVLMGVSWCVYEDREFFATIRYVYTASRSLVWYLLGRGVAKLLLGAISVAVILGLARWGLGVPLGVAPQRWVWATIGLALGTAATAFMGVGVAASLIFAARHGTFYSEAVAGLLYLLGGVVFPVDVLAAPLRAVALWTPQVYWFEVVRRLFVVAPPGAASAWGAILPAMGDGEVLGRLAVTSLLWAAAGLGVFQLALRHARLTGALDLRVEA